MIKGVVFDMDGLMFDTERLASEGWVFAGKQLGIDIPTALTTSTLGLNAENTRRVFLDFFGPDFDFRAIRAIRTEYAASYIERHGIPVKPGLIELLCFLKANGYKTAVATSTARDKALYNINKANTADFFDYIVSGDMITHGKPEPDIFLKACELLGLAPEDCLALEDSPAGILSASRAGMKPVMIPDLLQPDTETSGLLYAKLQSLHGVIELLCGP